jgi:hypothetical protein
MDHRHGDAQTAQALEGSAKAASYDVPVPSFGPTFYGPFCG